VLNPDDLLGGLRGFADATYGSFDGFPTTKPAARKAWGDAFGAYFAKAVELFAAPGPGTSMVTSGVSAAFCGTLKLDNAMSPSLAATDFADAWRDGVGAVTPGAGAPDPATTTTWTFIAWTNVAAQHDSLKAALEPIFTADVFSALTDLQQIAAAFHAASSGLQANANVKSASGTTQSTLKIE
jgi:hypothetical protein